MKLITYLLTLLLAAAAFGAEAKKQAMIQWKPYDCSNPLVFPEEQFECSMFGKGKYRIDGGMSQGHFNCIYIIFQAGNALDPASVPDAKESTFMLKDQQVTWRTFKTVVEGRSVLRKEALLPNILPHEKKDNDSDFIWIRIDGDSQQILDQLTPVAESILKDAL